MNSIAPIGFQDATNIYDQAQPSYLDEVIQFLKSWYATPTTIVDIGAVTGKLTRLLTNFSAYEIIANEPVASVREQ